MDLGRLHVGSLPALIDKEVAAAQVSQAFVASPNIF